jgi:hypothetical protein
MPIAANLGLFFRMSILLVESLMKALQHAPARLGNPQFWESGAVPCSHPLILGAIGYYNTCFLIIKLFALSFLLEYELHPSLL